MAEMRRRRRRRREDGEAGAGGSSADDSDLSEGGKIHVHAPSCINRDTLHFKFLLASQYEGIVRPPLDKNVFPDNCLTGFKRCDRNFCFRVFENP